MEGFKWENTPENMKLFETVLDNDEQYDLLKLMVKEGAPYLYPKDALETGRETIVEKCIKRNDYRFLSTLLDKHCYNPDLDEESDLLWKYHLGLAVEAAAEINDKKIAEILLGENARGYNIFVIARRGGWKYLECFEADVNEEDSNGNSMLHYAAREGRTSTIKYLIEEGASPDLKNADGQTPLHLAGLFQADNDFTLSILIENSNTNIPDNNGVTITQLLAEKGKYHFISRLIELGADSDGQNNNGNFLFIEAAKNGHTLTVKELASKGATIALEDGNRKSALDHALANHRDSTSAMLIRLDSRKSYINFFNQKYETDNNIQHLIKTQQRETIVALLDRSLNFDCSREEYKKITLELEVWEKGKILERIARWGDEELAYHGTIRMLVDSKMWKFGYKILSLKILFFLLFLLTLSYSLIQASTAGVARDTYTDGAWNIARILTDLFVLIYFLYNVLTESIEIFRIMRNTHEYLKSKKARRIKKVEDKSYETFREKSKEKHPRSLKSKLYNIFCIRVLVDYFSDLSNVFDTLGLSSLLLLIILRVAREEVQWVFATFTFFLNAVRIFKFIVLVPRLGPYSTIIFRILVKDVPLFSSLFLITLFIFTGGYFIALRTPYSSQGFSNASLVQDTTRTPGVDDRIYWVFMSGLRVLLEGNIYENNYLYNHLNWLAACIYLAFLFLTVVVFLNVFIAQLSDRYAEVKEKANQLYALQKLNFLVQIETTSVLSTRINFKNKFKLEQKKITSEEMLHYYHFSDPVSLNEAAINAVEQTKHYSQIPSFNIKKPLPEPDEADQQSSRDQLCNTLEENMEKVDQILQKTSSSISQVSTLESIIEDIGGIIQTKFSEIERKLSSP